MKKIILGAVSTAFVLFPLTGHADYAFWHAKEKNTRAHNTQSTIQRQNEADLKVRIDNTESAYVKQSAKSQTLPLADGNKIQIKGQAIYLIDAANGQKFFAPDGPYTTTQGFTYYAENGLVLRTEQPDEMVYVDTNLRDHDRDGYTDDVDINVQSHPVR